MNCHLAGLSLSQGSVGGREAFALDHPAFLRSAAEAPRLTAQRSGLTLAKRIPQGT